MTLSQIRNDILARIGPDHEIENSEIDTFINQGYDIVVGKIMDDFQDYFGDSEDITTVVGTQEYTPTKEYVALRFVDYNPGHLTPSSYPYVRVTPVNIAELGSLQNNDETRYSDVTPYYYFWGSKIGLLPIPTYAGTLKVYGIVKPAHLSADSDVPSFLSTHHHLLVTWGIKCMVEAVHENYIDGQRKMAEFEAGCEELLRLIGARQSDVAKKIMVTPLY